LFSVPKEGSLTDLTVQTRVGPAEGIHTRTPIAHGDAQLRVVLQAASGAKGMKGKIQLEGFDAAEGVADKDGKIEIVQPLSKPKLWSAEHPNLYALDVELKNAAGETI